jgi:predicted Zn-dependent protease with MMP-like domain
MSILDDIDVQIDRFDKLYEVICNIIEDKYDCATSEFVQDVRCVYLNKVRSFIRDMVNYHSLNKSLECVINDIPIHFGKQKVYKDYDDGEYLGLYRRNNDGTREIILFEDAIQAEAKGDNDYLKNLIWKVIIHEYAHAMMDTLQDNKIKSQDPKLYKYREESLANAFALKVLKSSGSGFRKIADFVESQPEEYQHGLDLYEREDLLKMMEFWREMKIEGNKRFK